MKLHSSNQPGGRRVTGYGVGFVSVGEEHLTESFVLTPEGIHRAVQLESVAGLRWSALPMLNDESIEVLLVGSGARQEFPPLELYAELAERRIGLEVMDTPAACRTYNILLAEGRQVAALMVV